MAPGCPSAQVLRDFCAGRTVSASVRNHFSGCSRCRALSSTIVQAAEALGDEPGKAFESEVAEIVRERLAATPKHRWWRLVVDEPWFVHRVVADVLARQADALYFKQPVDALAYAELALDTAMRLPNHAANDRLKIELRKDCAMLAVRLGKHDEAAEYLRAAVSAASALGDQYLLARIHFALGIAAASEPECIDVPKALTAFEEAHRIFSELDAERARDVSIAKGQLLANAGRWAEAAPILEAALPEASGTTKALVLHAIASCHVHLGRPEEALRVVDLARALHEREGNAVEITKCDWTRALALDGLGNSREAAILLGSVSERLFFAAMLDTAVRVELDRVAAMLRSGEEPVSILSLCRKVAELSMRLDRQTPSRKRHATAEALAYLRAAAEDHGEHLAALAETIDYARRYLGTLATRSDARFTPPPIALM